MRNQIEKESKPTLTVNQLERRYRAGSRKAGIRLCVLKINAWSAEQLVHVDRYCEAQQISRSEYVVDMLRRYMDMQAVAA